jgi:putative ABC transport system ATP-binding protein
VPKSAPASITDSPAALQLRGLSHSFREGERQRRVLDRLDLQLARGETLALIGQSGSGKSTLLNLIAGLEPPDAGEVLIAGQDITRLDEAARTRLRRRHIGFVYQGFNLLPTLNALENILLPLDLDGAAPAISEARARELLAQVGLAERAEAFPDQLSGGEQQRIALARALVHRPALILADEPTGNLDAESGARVLELLAELVREQNAALLLVTHSAAVAASADRVLQLRDGQLATPESRAAW